MGQQPSLATELRLRADDLKHLIRPKYVKGLTRSDVEYARPMFGTEPLHGQEILVIVGRFRHHIDGSGSLLSNSWEALTYDLAAIHGSIGSGPLAFQGVTTHLFDRFLNGPAPRNDATMHLFVLGPGELVRGVDICWQNRRMVGLRVHTNQRQSQWFGHRHGVVKTVTAPQGYFMNAIENLVNKTTRWELGLRMCPIPSHLHARSLGVCVGLMAPDKSTRVGTPPSTATTTDSSETATATPTATANTKSDGIQTDFAEMHEHVRAVVVKCGKDEGIEDLHVLSPEMFARHLAKREEPLPAKEHLFFLRDCEYIVQVDVHATDKVAALRFHTNLTKSPWYGTRSDEMLRKEPHKFTLPDTRLQIAGFHGTFGTKFLGTLGVFYQSIPATAAATSTTAMASSSSVESEGFGSTVVTSCAKSLD